VPAESSRGMLCLGCPLHHRLQGIHHFLKACARRLGRGPAGGPGSGAPRPGRAGLWGAGHTVTGAEADGPGAKMGFWAMGGEGSPRAGSAPGAMTQAGTV